MSGSGWEAHQVVRVRSGGPPGCPGVVGRPSRISGSGREALPNSLKAHPDVQEWSGCPSGRSGVPPECPGVVGRPSRMLGSGRESIPDARLW